MNVQFGETIKKFRAKQNLSQQELADKLFVTRSTVARWENGNRMPDATMIVKLAECLCVDVNILINAAALADKVPEVMVLDDEKIILQGSVDVLKKTFPNAKVSGFCIPNEALEYAMENQVDLAFLDIKMGRISGFDICGKLLEINPRMNIIYLTAYREFSFDAWSTGACGFLIKPLTVDSVREAVSRLSHTIKGVNI